MIETRDPLQAYYAARAKEYDTLYEKPERQADLRRLEKDIPEFLREKHVLEIACGTGYWTSFFASRAKSVTAVDATPEMLEIACTRTGVSGVYFRKADVYALPQDMGTFDAAFAGFWLSHVPIARRRDFFAELHKHLEPDARVLMLDNLYIEGNSTALSERDNGDWPLGVPLDDGNTYQIRKIIGGKTFHVLKNYPTRNELEDMVKPFAQNTTYRAYNYYWTFSYSAKP